MAHRQADKSIALAAVCQSYHGFLCLTPTPQPSTLTPVYPHLTRTMHTISIDIEANRTVTHFMGGGFYLNQMT